MNVPDRPRFLAEAFRVLKPDAFFALTERGLGPKDNPHYGYAATSTKLRVLQSGTNRLVLPVIFPGAGTDISAHSI